mgnify:CR=1 FL=1
MAALNLQMPGNPRYQPKSLQPFFGYDMYARFLAEVELAALETLGEFGVIPAETMALLTPEVKESVLAITTTEMDRREREVTKHDIRAWVQLAQERMEPELARFVHIPLTSYDVVDPARILQFQRSYTQVVRPKLARLLHELADKVEETAGVVQIGRTHGQAALPVTVGFWLATILQRLLHCYMQMEFASEALVGKISGAVGAKNAQYGLGIQLKNSRADTFETAVLERLELIEAPISTQILPPEPLATYLFQVLLTSAALGQFGRDCRHLMRSEIGEVREVRPKDAAGSSTMAHKTNPINFENIEGRWLASKSEFGKVLDTLISEHQRDLVGSSVVRDFPVLVINLITQIERLLAEKDGQPFLRRIEVNTKALQRNLSRSVHLSMAEPIYLALQIAGYTGDAHRLVADEATPLVVDQQLRGENPDELIEMVYMIATRTGNKELQAALGRIPDTTKELLGNPSGYTGNAQEQALDVVEHVRGQIRRP